jgi:hypothetical protein
LLLWRWPPAGFPALYAAQRRGSGTTGYRRQHPHCLGRLFGQLRQPLRLRLHVRDDEVVYVETDNTGDDRYGDHQVRACLRGRSIRRASIIRIALTIP